jgi:DNA-binding transcriptional ArsR family regulator
MSHAPAAASRSNLTLSDEKIEMLRRYFWLLNCPFRVQALLLIARRPQRVMDLCTQLNCEQSNMSSHVKRLMIVGALRREPKGRCVYYKLEPLGKRMVKAILTLSSAKARGQ